MWYVYIVECADKTFYTGIAINLEKRMREHNGGKRGANYTRIRRPVKLMYSVRKIDRISAMKEELRIKKLSRQGKMALCHGRSAAIR